MSVLASVGLVVVPAEGWFVHVCRLKAEGLVAAGRITAVAGIGEKSRDRVRAEKLEEGSQFDGCQQLDALAGSQGGATDGARKDLGALRVDIGQTLTVSGLVFFVEGAE